MHKNRVIFFFTLKSGFSASPEVLDLGKTGPEFPQVSMLPKPAHLPNTGLSSLAGQTPALSQAQTLRPQLLTGFPHIAHLLCYLFIYLFEEKKGRNFFATVCTGKVGKETSGTEFTTGSL